MRIPWDRTNFSMKHFIIDTRREINDNYKVISPECNRGRGRGEVAKEWELESISQSFPFVIMLTEDIKTIVIRLLLQKIQLQHFPVISITGRYHACL